MREGIARILAEAGLDVVAQSGDAEDLLRKTLAHRPDVVVADVQMPPGHGDDGLRAALEVRRRLRETGVLILSQYYEEDYALELIGDRPEGVGYLLKERVGDVDAFIQAVARVAAGGSALDPEVVGRMLGRRRGGGPLDELSPRERDVLAAMAEGKSNQGIADALVVTEAAVEKHVTGIFQKLGLGPTATEHRRVRARARVPEGPAAAWPHPRAKRYRPVGGHCQATAGAGLVSLDSRLSDEAARGVGRLARTAFRPMAGCVRVLPPTRTARTPNRAAHSPARASPPPRRGR